MKKVVITGATSFIGLHLIEKLSTLDYEIYAIIRENSSKKSLLSKFKNINIVELNMENIEQLPNFINEKCDTMYHFAWNGTRGEERDNEEMQMLNVENSLSTLKAAKEIGCKTFFTSGSQAEYGIQNESVNENVVCQPVTAYGKAKLAFYEKAKEYCQENNIRLVEPRFFSIYGPGDFSQTLVMSTISKMKENLDVELSSCMQTWNFLYIKDAVNALVMLNEKESAEGVFNLASDNTRVLKDFVLEIKDVLQTNSKLVFGEKTPSGINPDITKLKKTINWQENYTFKEGIQEIIDNL